MIRQDHLAWRSKSRIETANFFVEAFGYKIQTEFTIYFNDEKTETAQCIALEPTERVGKNLPWKVFDLETEFHAPPEIFVSEGSKGSIVDLWLDSKNAYSMLHHLAYQVDSVENEIKNLKEKKLMEFSSEKPFQCDDGLIQIFSKPHKLTGLIYEFIERKDYGFCVGNTKNLMLSTKGD